MKIIKLLILVFYVSGYSQNIINNTQIDYYADYVKVGLKELNINPYLVVINTVNFEEDSLLGYVTFNRGVFRMNLSDKLMFGDQLRVIAHELIHIKQYYHHKLIVTNDLVIHNNIIYIINNLPSYEKRQWEIEAFIYEKILRTKILNRLQNGKFN